MAGGPGSAAAPGDSVWIAPSTGLLTRLDPSTGRVVQTIDPNAGPAAVAVGADAVWVTDSDANTVTRVDPTGLLTPIPVGHGPCAIAVGAGGVWVVDALDDAVVRIDPSTRAVTTTIPVGRHPTGIAVGAGSVWVANSGDGTVTRIDPAARQAAATIRSVEARRASSSRGPGLGDRRPDRRSGAPGGSSGGTAAFERAESTSTSWILRSRSSQILAAPVRHLREARQLSGQARSRRLPARARGRPVAADAVAGRQDLHVHDPQRLPLLAALERAGHRPDLQVLDRADPRARR